MNDVLAGIRVLDFLALHRRPLLEQSPWEPKPPIPTRGPT